MSASRKTAALLVAAAVPIAGGLIVSEFVQNCKRVPSTSKIESMESIPVLQSDYGSTSLDGNSSYVMEQSYELSTPLYTISGFYTGKWKNGKPEGQGSFQYAGSWHSQDDAFFCTSGDCCIGTWKNGVMEGAGKFIFTSGIEYLGDFEASLPTGQGKKVGRTETSILENSRMA